MESCSVVNGLKMEVLFLISGTHKTWTVNFDSLVLFFDRKRVQEMNFGENGSGMLIECYLG